MQKRRPASVRRATLPYPEQRSRAKGLGAAWHPSPSPCAFPHEKAQPPLAPPPAQSPPPPMVVMMVPEKKKALPRSQAEWLLLLVELVSGFAPPPRASATSCRTRCRRGNLSPSCHGNPLALPSPGLFPTPSLPALPFPLVSLQAVS